MGYRSVTASSSEHDDNIAVVTVKGKIVTSLSATEVVRIIESIMKQTGVPRIIINLAGLDYIDSFSFNWILQVYRQLENTGGALVICEPNDDIKELFELTNFGKAVPIYLTEQQAREALKTGNEENRIAC